MSTLLWFQRFPRADEHGVDIGRTVGDRIRAMGSEPIVLAGAVLGVFDDEDLEDAMDLAFGIIAEAQTEDVASAIAMTMGEIIWSPEANGQMIPFGDAIDRAMHLASYAPVGAVVADGAVCVALPSSVLRGEIVATFLGIEHAQVTAAERRAAEDTYAKTGEDEIEEIGADDLLSLPPPAASGATPTGRTAPLPDDAVEPPSGLRAALSRHGTAEEVVRLSLAHAPPELREELRGRGLGILAGLASSNTAATDPKRAARAYIASAAVLLEGGRHREAVRASLQALAETRGAADRRGEEAALLMLARCYTSKGRENDAKKLSAAAGKLGSR